MCEPEGKGGGTQIELEKNLYWKIQSHHLPWDLGHWMVDLSSALRTCWEDPTLNWKQEGQKKPVHAMVLTYTFSWECTPFVAGRWVGADTWQNKPSGGAPRKSWVIVTLEGNALHVLTRTLCFL